MKLLPIFGRMNNVFISKEKIVEWLASSKNRAIAEKQMPISRTTLFRAHKTGKVSDTLQGNIHRWFLLSGHGPDDMNRSFDITVKGEVRP